MKKILYAVLAVQPFIIVLLLVFYFEGVKKQGDFLKEQEMYVAAQDSIRTLESVLSSFSFGDSTMVGMEEHTSFFEDTKQHETYIGEMKTAIDSLQREKSDLEEISDEITQKKTLLDYLSNKALDENIINLAKLYDNMKPAQSVPIIIGTNDTTAVLIILNMEDRSASKLLGSIAETDLEKATRISKLLAMMGAIK